jgi:SAM-dependent methyltransferase
MARSSDVFFKQYNVFGEDWMKGQLASPLRNSRRAFLAQLNIPLKKKVLLDAGCGYGHDLAAFAQRGAAVHGIDGSKEMIALARRHNPGLTTLSVQRLQKTNFSAKFFDVVISQYALHNAIDLKPAFLEMHRILKPGGILLYLVQHPLFVFFARKSRNYHRRETVTFTIPDMQGHCAIRQPAHTFSEYFNDDVLTRFDVLAFDEGPEPVPMWFLAKLRKKRGA